jgi:hypothetical protein
MGSLATGLAYLTATLKAKESVPATYARGYDSVEIRAFLGDQLLKLDDGMGGFRIEHTDLDVFIANDDDFTFGAGRIVPERGDVVWLAFGGCIRAFEVFPFSNTEPTHRLVHLGTMYRIHTKYVDMEQFS